MLLHALNLRYELGGRGSSVRLAPLNNFLLVSMLYLVPPLSMRLARSKRRAREIS